MAKKDKSASVHVEAHPPIRHLTKKDVCFRLQISGRTLERLLSTNAFPAPIRLGVGRGVARWPLAVIEAWETAQQQAAGAQN